MDITKPEWKDAYNKALADILRARKDELRMTYPEIIAATGITLETVQRLINGKRAITMANFIPLVRALKLEDPAAVLSQAEDRVLKASL